jgi:hypothetical protein
MRGCKGLLSRVTNANQFRAPGLGFECAFYSPRRNLACRSSPRFDWRMPEAPPPLESVAYEEAAHAVILWALGLGRRIKLATIKPRRGSWARVEHRKILRKGDEDNESPIAKARIECLILVSLAGQYGRKADLADLRARRIR